MRASILDVDANLIGIALLGNLRIVIVKGGITEPESERITHGHVERVEVAVTHIDILLVVGIVNVPPIAFLTLAKYVDARILVNGEIL